MALFAVVTSICAVSLPSQEASFLSFVSEVFFLCYAWLSAQTQAVLSLHCTLPYFLTAQNGAFHYDILLSFPDQWVFLLSVLIDLLPANMDNDTSDTHSYGVNVCLMRTYGQADAIL